MLGVNGELVGNISARHAYYIVTAENKLRRLNMRAVDFLKLGAAADGAWNIRSTAIVCKAHDTLVGAVAGGQCALWRPVGRVRVALLPPPLIRWVDA